MARLIDLGIQNIIGSKVREYRLEFNMSQQELSDRLETYAVYICRGSMSRLENHDRTVTDFELKAIAQALNVPIMDLFEQQSRINF